MPPVKFFIDLIDKLPKMNLKSGCLPIIFIVSKITNMPYKRLNKARKVLGDDKAFASELLNVYR